MYQSTFPGDWEKMPTLERRPKNGKEGSHSGSSDYAASTPSSIENRCPNQTQQIDKFIYKKKPKL